LLGLRRLWSAAHRVRLADEEAYRASSFMSHHVGDDACRSPSSGGSRDHVRCDRCSGAEASRHRPLEHRAARI